MKKSLYDAARITVYGSSRRTGRPLKALSDAWDLRIADEGPNTARGGRVFLAWLPPLGEAAPKLFEQRSLFGDDLNPEDTVLDWLGDVASAVWGDERTSRLLDSEILSQLAKYKNSSREGLEDAVIETRRYSSRPVHVNSELGRKAESLVRETPPNQVARVKGFLNQIAYLERILLLKVAKGQNLRVLWQPDDIEAIKSLLGRDVLLEGKLQFRPSGQPLILIADRVREATSRDVAWEQVPHSRASTQMKPPTLLPQEANPLEKLQGILDGNFDDEQFARMVEEFSRA